MARQKKRVQDTKASDLSKVPKAPKAPKTSKSPASGKAPEWQYTVFADLHVRADTLKRSLTTLQVVRETALKQGKQVICLGDFWDRRGVLDVRQLDAILDEFEKWKEAGIEMIMVPGNHDQVSVDGRIHGLRTFDYFDNIHVVMGDSFSADDLYFVPWHEDGKLQKQFMSQVQPGQTVFAHGELKGSTANNGHKMDGKFNSSDTKKAKARAVYLGHFHKRQNIDNIWYIGSPFEKDFGEMGTPHGIAVVSSNKIEPDWIEIPDMPKHYRYTYPEDVQKFLDPTEIDIVEVLIPATDIGSSPLSKAIKALKATDVRPIPISAQTDSEAPPIAMSLDEGLEAYANEFAESGWSLKPEEVIKLGQYFLSKVPDTEKIAAVASKVTILDVELEGFCPIKKKVKLSLDKRGLLLLRGKMRVGKTSLFDGLTWVLFNKTTPRKPGSAGNSLGADEVINDEGSSVKGIVRIKAGEDIYKVTRTKSRGKGSKVQIEPEGDAPAIAVGVTDTDLLIKQLVGVDYSLWRNCVYLGQGAVANFVTDTDKFRKQMLSGAYSLGSCEHALKLVKKGRSKIVSEQTPIEVEQTRVYGKIEALEALDLDAEISSWEQNRKGSIEESNKRILTFQSQVEEWDKLLEAEPSWLKAQTDLETRRGELTAQITKSSPENRVNQIHAHAGAAKSELSTAERDLTNLEKSYSGTQEGPGNCPTCGQAMPMETHENHLQDMEQQIQNKRNEIETVKVKLSNFVIQLGELQSQGTAETESLKTQLEEVQQKLNECAQGLSAIATIKSNRQNVVNTWNSDLKEIESQEQAINPFATKKKETEVQILQLRDTAADLMRQVTDLQGKQKKLAFLEDAFGQNGIPVIVLRNALAELEMHANGFLNSFTSGELSVQMLMLEDDLQIKYFERREGELKERSYSQLSGGQRRCVELAFVPFALSELIFNKVGVRIPLLIIDELTTHLDSETKPLVTDILSKLLRETVVVIDHDQQVQGAFDKIVTVSSGGELNAA